MITIATTAQKEAIRRIEHMMQEELFTLVCKIKQCRNEFEPQLVCRETIVEYCEGDINQLYNLMQFDHFNTQHKYWIIDSNDTFVSVSNIFDLISQADVLKYALLYDLLD
jgi:cytidine deaminase